MPDENRMAIAKSMTGGRNNIIDRNMAARKQKLDAKGGNMMGGLFDLIYRKRKERESALDAIDE